MEPRRRIGTRSKPAPVNGASWAGVDVGGPRKGFHVVVLSSVGLLESPMRLARPGEVADWLACRSPQVVAVDSPRRPAPAGMQVRPDERDFARARICGIRPTPDDEAIRSHPKGYYDWVRNGFDLYRELTALPDWHVIECFPTASFTRMGAPRGKTSRAAWSRRVLSGLELRRLPSRMNQDERDAVMAALTARAYSRAEVERFGEIYVAARPDRRRALRA